MKVQSASLDKESARDLLHLLEELRAERWTTIDSLLRDDTTSLALTSAAFKGWEGVRDEVDWAHRINREGDTFRLNFYEEDQEMLPPCRREL